MKQAGLLLMKNSLALGEYAIQCGRSLSTIFVPWFFPMRKHVILCQLMFLKEMVVVVFLLCVSVFLKEESGTIKVVGLIPTKSVYIANALAGPHSAIK